MPGLRRTLTVTAPLDRVATYLCDLTTSVEWDPHTVSCRALDDEIVPGARYQHTREFAGRAVTLIVTVQDFERRTRITWSGGNQFADGHEEFAFTATGDGGTTVTHGVEVTLRGPARIGNRMVPGIMRRIADDGTDVLLARLEHLA